MNDLIKITNKWIAEYEYGSSSSTSYCFQEAMKEYAALMCEKQRDICAIEGSIQWEGTKSINDVVKQVLNSPLPKELQ